MRSTDHATAVVPRFTLLLPSGGVSEPVDTSHVDALATRVSAVFRDQHCPELDAWFQPMWRRAAHEMRSRRVVRIAYPRRGR